MAVPELISTNAGRQPLVVNQIGNGFAEAMGSHVRQAEVFAGGAPLFGKRTKTVANQRIWIEQLRCAASDSGAPG